METRRLRRIKPQPTSVRRLRWLPQRRAPARPQSEQEEITALLAVLRREAVCRLPLLNRKAIWPIIWVTALLEAIALWKFGAPSAPVFARWELVILLASSLLFLCMLLSRLMVSQRQSWAVRQLTGAEDLSVIPPLAAALRWPEPGLRSAAAAALTRLLPLLQPSDAALLDAATRASLHKQLAPSKSSHSESLALAILKGLERVGDSRDLRRVGAIAGSKVRTDTEQRMQRAAQECLREIKRRTEADTRAVEEDEPAEEINSSLKRLS